MESIKEFPRGISDQVISLRAHDGERERASWSGPQATSCKQQASSTKLIKQQAASIKPRCQGFKLQATSFKRQYP